MLFRSYTATITASGAVKIQFVPAKRFFLDDVKVTSVATSVQGISVGDVVPVAVYSVSGMLVNYLRCLEEKLKKMVVLKNIM